MAKLKAIFLKSTTIEIRFNSVGKFYPISREKLCEMKDNGTLLKTYDSMFEPEQEVDKKYEARKIASDNAKKLAEEQDQKDLVVKK